MNGIQVNIYLVSKLEFKLKNIDDRNVYSLTHNPLTLQEDFLDKVGLELKGIFFEITLPAPIVEFLSILIGAIKEEFDPTKTLSLIIVLFFLYPS